MRELRKHEWVCVGTMSHCGDAGRRAGITKRKNEERKRNRVPHRRGAGAQGPFNEKRKTNRESATGTKRRDTKVSHRKDAGTQRLLAKTKRERRIKKARWGADAKASALSFVTLSPKVVFTLSRVPAARHKNPLLYVLRFRRVWVSPRRCETQSRDNEKRKAQNDRDWGRPSALGQNHHLSAES